MKPLEHLRRIRYLILRLYFNFSALCSILQLGKRKLFVGSSCVLNLCRVMSIAMFFPYVNWVPSSSEIPPESLSLRLTKLFHTFHLSHVFYS